jgi:hypothetical protein
METNVDDLEKLRYPVGRLDTVRTPATTHDRGVLLQQIAAAPAVFRSLTHALGDAQLDTPYRPGGWTVRQVIHHVPDSHLNAYIRMKLAATEDAPAIRTYEESRWAELPEAKSAPIAMSLDLLDALHRRWIAFLAALPDSAFARTFVHPEWGAVSLDRGIAMYEWHCRHHAAHVRQALGIGS